MKKPSVGPRSWRTPLAAAGTLAVLSGCATYQPRPLEDQSPLVTEPGGLQVEAAAPQGGAAGGYNINLADGLDLTEVGILAVINNPGLRKQRAQWQVAGAQAFAAGLLPDPQISAGLDKPTGSTTGLVDAWSLGLGYDIIPLITRQARVDAARKQSAIIAVIHCAFPYHLASLCADRVFRDTRIQRLILTVLQVSLTPTHHPVMILHGGIRYPAQAL